MGQNNVSLEVDTLAFLRDQNILPLTAGVKHSGFFLHCLPLYIFVFDLVVLCKMKIICAALILIFLWANHHQYYNVTFYQLGIYVTVTPSLAFKVRQLV